MGRRPRPHPRRQWYAIAWLAPEKDFAVLVACNQADDKACNDAVLALIADHFKGEGR